jgi:hypothetical protein
MVHTCGRGVAHNVIPSGSIGGFDVQAAIISASVTWTTVCIIFRICSITVFRLIGVVFLKMHCVVLLQM